MSRLLIPFQCIAHFVYGLSVATEDEYPKCRMLARRMLELHVDGFTYRSFFSSVKADELTNIALFGHPHPRWETVDGLAQPD
jgi:hypothetical protein